MITILIVPPSLSCETVNLCACVGFSGNPAMRQGKPGSGFGFGYGLRFKSQFGHFQADYAVNAFQQSTLYFGLSNLAS